LAGTLHAPSRPDGAYVANLNAQIEANPALKALRLDAFQGQIARFPAAVRNNGGGHWNHSLFWELLAPAGQAGEPSAELAAAIDRDLGDMDKFKGDMLRSRTWTLFTPKKAGNYTLNIMRGDKVLKSVSFTAVDAPKP